MSDEQKEIKPTTKFGSVQQQRETVGEFQTIGSKGKPMIIATKQPDTEEPTSSEEMKRQTVYMPKSLAQRLKVHAALTDGDISGIITKLVETYLNEVEGK